MRCKQFLHCSLMRGIKSFQAGISASRQIDSAPPPPLDCFASSLQGQLLWLILCFHEIEVSEAI